MIGIHFDVIFHVVWLVIFEGIKTVSSPVQKVLTGSFFLQNRPNDYNDVHFRRLKL